MKDKELHKTANDLLEKIRETSGKISWLEEAFNIKLKKLEEEYNGRINEHKASMGLDEKALKSLMKKNKKVLFDGTDIVDLASGRLLHETNDKVSLSRDTLDLCKQHGFKEAVKIAESIDRSVLEKWADAKLLLVGGTRKKVESYNYEIKK